MKLGLIDLRHEEPPHEDWPSEPVNAGFVRLFLISIGIAVAIGIAAVIFILLWLAWMLLA